MARLTRLDKNCPACLVALSFPCDRPQTPGALLFVFDGLGQHVVTIIRVNRKRRAKLVKCRLTNRSGSVFGQVKQGVGQVLRDLATVWGVVFVFFSLRTMNW